MLALVVLIAACGTPPSNNNSDGGGGDLAMCSPSDCPATGTACATPSCVNNACDKAYASAGTTCDDAGGKVCDGNGACVACVMPSDCAAPTTACKTSTCTANACGTRNVPSGSCNDNGGKLCDGNGTCVACLAAADCPTPATACKLAAWTRPRTPVAPPMPQRARAARTAAASFATATARASRCTAWTACGTPTRPTSTAAVARARRARPGNKCQADIDCTSSACDATTLACVSSQCADHRKDGAETDVDCGGGVCATCGLGLHCSVDSDCTSSACDAISLTCASNQCSDHRQDGMESDVDCGGSVCSACAVGQKCNTIFDCQPGHVCNTSHLCQ